MAHHIDKLPREQFKHSCTLQLRFGDIDSMGHVNNNVYLQLCDVAKCNYFATLYGGTFDPAALSIVVVNINCDFLAVTTLDEPVAARTAVVAIGDKSITLCQQVFNSATGEVKCQCTSVMASFDPVNGTSAPLQEHIRRAICDYEQRQF